jgi:hypothetical protein
MLLEPTQSFSSKVLASKDYLNCPKFILNHRLDCFYRQFYDNPQKAIEVISKELVKYNFTNPIKSAREFVEWREGIKTAEFNRLNVNSYIEETPAFVDARHKHLSDWIERHTKEVWRYGMLLDKHVPSYPYADI